MNPWMYNPLQPKGIINYTLNLQEGPNSHADPVEWLTAMILRGRCGPSVSSISNDKDDDDFAELFDPMSFYSKFSLSPYNG